MPRSLLVLSCAAAVLLAAGCGGGGGGRQRLSEADFRTRANHVCDELNRQEKSDLGSTSKASVDRDLSRIDSAVSQLEALRLPARDATRYRALLKHFKRSVALVRAKEPLLIQLARDLRLHPSDARTMARYERIFRPFLQNLARAGADARALGLTTCANGLGGGSSSQPSP
jgi:hypothetical protein